MSSVDKNMVNSTYGFLPVLISASVKMQDGVIYMHKSWLDVLLAVCLGVICPAILIFAMTQPEKTNEELVRATEATVETVAFSETVYIDVLQGDGSCVNMDLEEYIVGVVLNEMPASFETEALKAQAVVARTYALRRYDKGGKHDTADVCVDPSCCQGYCSVEAYIQKGATTQQVQKVTNAVDATKGLVLRYEGELIEATYFSCSGGSTEDAVAVWGADIPYLRSVESPGEESATHFTDTEVFSTGDFASTLGISSNAVPESWIESVSYTEGGGVATIRICGTDYSGTQIRSLLNLRSTSFVISIIGDTVTITTKGYGHRVGMSQYGADAMAVGGSTFDEILFHYYQGTELTQY